MRLQNHSSCVLTTQLLAPLGDTKESFIVTVTHSTLERRWPSYHSSKTPPLPWYLPVVFAPSTDKDAAPARVALGCFWEDWSICPHQKALLSLVTHSMSVHTDKLSELKTGYMPVQLQCFETLSPCMSAIDPPSLVSLVSSGSWVKWNWGSYDHILQVLLGHKHLECLQYGQQQCKCTHRAHFKGPLPGKWFPLFIVLVLVFSMHCVFFRSFFPLLFKEGSSGVKTFS